MNGVFTHSVDREILAFIHRSMTEIPRDEAFNRLALEIFAHQFSRNASYRMFCMQRRAAPDQIFSWEQIPAAPTGAFKAGAFCGFSPGNAVRVFETSGTTGAAKGLHYFDTLKLYDESALPNFSLHLLPDGARLPMRMLLPPPEEAPRSSLVHMCHIVAESFAENAEWFVRGGKLRVEEILRDLEMSAATDRPRMILGAAFSFVHLLESMEERRVRIRLPEGSRIMETGGYKGRSREMPQRELYDRLAEFLGIPPSRIINEYGMTELSSQMYDDRLRRGRTVDVHVPFDTGPSVAGAPLAPQLLRDSQPSIKIPPPWVRVRMVDPKSFEPAPAGTPGLIRVLDLANRGSAIAIQTEDVGIEEGPGFRVIGRAQGADSRGCSLDAESLVRPS